MGAAGEEGLGDEVTEGVVGVGAEAVGFFDFERGEAGGVEGPGDLFEVADEFLALGVDGEVGFAVVVAEAAVDAVDAVADGGLMGMLKMEKLKRDRQGAKNCLMMLQSVVTPEVRRWLPLESPEMCSWAGR